LEIITILSDVLDLNNLFVFQNEHEMPPAASHTIDVRRLTFSAAPSNSL